MFRHPVIGMIVAGIAELLLAGGRDASGQSASGEPALPTVSAAVAPWRYDFALRAWGTRSEGEWGTRTFDGKELNTAALHSIVGGSADQIVGAKPLALRFQVLRKRGPKGVESVVVMRPSPSKSKPAL